MLYYVKLDRKKEFLEIKSVKNIHQLTKEIKINWVNIKEYLEVRSEILNCGVRMPFIKKQNKEMYLISEVKGYLELKNWSYMSRDVLREIGFIESFKNGFDGPLHVID